MTPVASLHPQACGIWKRGHGCHCCWRSANLTIVVDLLMLAEDCQAKIYQARTGILDEINDPMALCLRM
eukprot:1708009-Amphidinium_carterae.1